MDDLSRMPTLFLSHGSPLYAVQTLPVTQAWAALASTLPKPRAILMVSAHWESRTPTLTGAPQPETLHDFGGFPPELYRLRYPAPGAPELALTIQHLLRDAAIPAEIDPARGLDHGAWAPLRHLYPKADIPTLQLSVQPRQDARHHYRIGQALATLRHQGILLIGSGHMTHNLGDWFHAANAPGPLPYAVAFRDWINTRVLNSATEDLLNWTTAAPHARQAHPTPEHFLPLFVALGAANGDTPQSLFSGYEGNTLALDAYRFG